MFIRILLVSLFIFSCTNNLTSTDNSLDKISLSIEKDIYSAADSIKLTIYNKSDYDIIIYYRCSYKNLEMFFQQKKDNEWSKNRYFDYMCLRCVSLPKMITKENNISHLIAAKEFKEKGIFRLLLPFNIPEIDSSITIISEEFEIQ